MKVKVIGIGNPLASDDGVGVHIARELLKNRLPKNVEVIEAESPGPSILELVAGAEKIILIDAAIGNGKPGTIHKLSLDDLRTGRRRLRSLHEISLLDLLEVGRLTDPESFPGKLVILGIEVANIMRYREGLSDPVRNSIPAAVEAVMDEIASDRTSG